MPAARASTSSAVSKKAAKKSNSKSSSKKAAVKTPSTKSNGSAKKAAPKKAAKKSAAKKSPAKKSAKKAVAKKSAAKKSAAKKSPAKKSAAASKAAAKAPAKKSPAKKPAAKNAAKAPAKKAASTRSKTPASTPGAGKKDGKKKSSVTLPKFLTDKKWLAQQRAALLEERKSYTHSAESLAAEAASLMADREPGDVQFDEESGEGDTLAVERDRDLALSAKAREKVDEIDAALARMDAGTYGQCISGEDVIPKERLEALPMAAKCVTHQTAMF